ncbi:MAG: hypothetical protein ACREIF_14265 [Chthoniobacterales bacterium]
MNDEPIPMPRQIVQVAVIKAQAEVPSDQTLVRDHGSPHDVVLRDGEAVDLRKGNTFYTLATCDVKPRGQCDASAKLTYFVDDRPELTLNPKQTGQTIRDLFGLSKDVNLIRDYESSHDEPVQPSDRAPFEKGPVFITRRQHVELTITVNHKKFTETDGVKHHMTGRQIAALVSGNPDRTEVFRLGKGEPEGVPLDKEIRVENCDEFRVIRNNVAGGFEPSRIERELKRLRDGGARADFIGQPLAVVIYRDVPTRPGYRHLDKTDVLVTVPGGYPGQPLDGAHLPEGSPLLGRVAGSPQGIVIVEGRRWQLVSYHPHNGGGAAPWNKDKHGLDTYFDEVLCWIHRANN